MLQRKKNSEICLKKQNILKSQRNFVEVTPKYHPTLQNKVRGITLAESQNTLKSNSKQTCGVKESPRSGPVETMDE